MQQWLNKKLKSYICIYVNIFIPELICVSIRNFVRLIVFSLRMLSLLSSFYLSHSVSISFSIRYSQSNVHRLFYCTTKIKSFAFSLTGTDQIQTLSQKINAPFGSLVCNIIKRMQILVRAVFLFFLFCCFLACL